MTGLAWLALLLGLIVLGWCVLMPREIGKEDEPLSNVRLSLPDVEGMVSSMRQRRARPHPAVPVRPVPAPSPAPEGPSALGAPQPVLSQDPAGLALPGQ